MYSWVLLFGETEELVGYCGTSVCTRRLVFTIPDFIKKYTQEAGHIEAAFALPVF